MRVALLAAVFVISTCGLVYELASATLASYLLGDTVLQFSTIIGTYLSAMGAGAWLTRYVDRRVVHVFVQAELLVGAIGGWSAAVLSLCFVGAASFRVPLYGCVGVIGLLVGIELPLLMRILKDRVRFAELVARALTADYAGALLASLLFPLFLVPKLGLIRSTMVFGMINTLVGLWTLRLFRLTGPWAVWQRVQGWAIVASLLAGLVWSDRLVRWLEVEAFPDDIIHAVSSPYQRIVLTGSDGQVSLYLNGHLQFDSADEYRYHEALVHPALGWHPDPRRVLVLGGGDGLALREVLRHAKVRAATLVELDPAMLRLAAEWPALRRLNAGALRDPRVRVVNADALAWLRDRPAPHDVVIVDFPDPTTYALGKLYTVTMYRLLRRAVAPGGIVVVQATSPLAARRSFWTIETTIRAAGFRTVPYHGFIASFGEWGFVLAATAPPGGEPRWLPGLRYLSPETFAAMRAFPPDMARLPAEANRLDTQLLVRTYEEEWGPRLRRP